MQTFPPVLAHGGLQEVFPGVFFVSGAMETVLHGCDWCFSRNMTVVREDDRLVLFNSVRLGEEGLAALDRLGRVTDVVCLGALHGRDDPFYVSRYGARYWRVGGGAHESGLEAHHRLEAGGPLPVSGATLFEFSTTRLPEAILLLEREGGIAIACDALQNWLAPDEYFSDASRQLMQDMGFFTPANFGPVWMQAAVPQAADFSRLAQHSFRHALCGHGEPLRDSADSDFRARFEQVFGDGGRQ
ncbi:hypothetical protein GRF61_04765 [Azoarcus sp. TTM-91]|uniref:hypothetical protein n=1 Tax=Azoarcus sp. TTM-91 TaxID=2691581 RepID=UPI00145EB6DD|nr:hypothetical protein [Azoarcus sp. TTM-91]NMG33760.1 hypothetical protein [Azoarcus sp. TTM-91]